MAAKKIRFNILDVVIILVILSIVFLGIYIFFPHIDPISSEDANAKFTVIITDCDENVAKAFTEAFEESVSETNTQDIKFKVGVKELADAELLSCDVTPAMTYIANDETKELVPVEKKHKQNVTLVFNAKVTMTDDSIILGNTPLRIGSQITVMSQKASGNGYVEKMITYY